MKKRKVVKKAVVKKPASRKDYIKENLVDHLEEIQPELNRTIDLSEVVALNGLKGSFRDYLDGDLKPSDRKLLVQALAELKKEKVLFHKTGSYWQRLK